MSFILDALKKSESERQRQTGPAFAAVPRSTARRRRVPWAAVIAGVLLVNAVVLGILLLRQPDAVVVPAPAGPGGTTALVQPGAETTTSTPPGGAGSAPRPPPTRETSPTAIGGVPDEPPATGNPAATAPGPAASSLSGPESAGLPSPAPGSSQPAPQAPAGADTQAPPRQSVRSLAEEARAGRPEASTGESGERAPATSEPRPPAPAAGAPATGRAGPGVDPLALPTMQIAVAEGRVPGPVLNLDLHVWYPDPARRVVFIEGRKYREGDEITGGAALVEIVPEGAVLEHRGHRFLLTPR